MAVWCLSQKRKIGDISERQVTHMEQKDPSVYSVSTRNFFFWIETAKQIAN